MKKFARVVMTVFLVIAFTTNCFGATISNDLISPYYIGTDTIMTSFNISNSGTATMRGNLVPKNSTAMDEVKVTFVIKDAYGDVVYNKTHTAVWNSLYLQYKAEKSYRLSSKGIYTLNATYACYKNDTLVERIHSKGIAKTY